MKGFIPQLAGVLYDRYGDDISSLVVLLPGQRARLFFRDALSKLTDKPLWQPSFPSVDEIMSGISGLRKADHIRLVTELYGVYSQFHTESLDDFYPWGETLLADFDAVDKYMIDAQMLFTNISDLRELDGDLAYLNEEQREIIKRFWGTLGPENEFSDEKKAFTSLWKSLWPIYKSFRQRLAGEGIGYSGMIYRDAVQKMANATSAAELGLDGTGYVVAGFNALTACERKLFDFLAAQGKTYFFWDIDSYYMDDPRQEAGNFMRENLRRYPQALPLPGGLNNFVSPKRVYSVSAPSDTLQCKYVSQFLSEVSQSLQTTPGTETAVVLTDEELLVPVLHSIPGDIPDINVTMGYPLRMTLAYSFVERLTGLQFRKREKGTKVMFYHADVTGLLRHPFIQESQGAARLATDITNGPEIYIDADKLAGEGIFSQIFASAGNDAHGLAAYLLAGLDAAIKSLYSKNSQQEDTGSGREEHAADLRLEIEFLLLAADTVRKLDNSASNCGVELSARVFSSLLRKAIRGVKIPYEGEPLKGVQVMGMLETRNLDFENVAIIALNDDTFPGNRIPVSLIPQNLRLAYGLPTQQYHESVYAYDFYRLLQRAGRADLVSSSRSDEKKSGEPSRYIYQLEYESPHDVVHRTVALDVNVPDIAPITVVKDEKVREQMAVFIARNGADTVRLSPTALSNYIACPLRFYFYSVARLRPEEEPAEEIDDMMFGTLLHDAAESLYRPAIGKREPQAYLRPLMGSPDVEKAVKEAVCTIFPPLSSVPEEEWGGNVLMVKDIITRYLNSCLLPYDSARSGYTVEETEAKIETSVRFISEGRELQVIIGGKADRIDRLSDGRLMVIDYKTGAEKINFTGTGGLFSPASRERNPAVFQTLIYSMIINRERGVDVVPALYFLRKLNSEDYSPQPNDKSLKCKADSYLKYRDEFEERLSGLLSEIFDPAIPFTQCEEDKPCRWCDFNTICRRV